jgi:hypothetical protein
MKQNIKDINEFILVVKLNGIKKVDWFQCILGLADDEDERIFM